MLISKDSPSRILYITMTSNLEWRGIIIILHVLISYTVPTNAEKGRNQSVPEVHQHSEFPSATSDSNKYNYTEGVGCNKILRLQPRIFSTKGNISSSEPAATSLSSFLNGFTQSYFIYIVDWTERNVREDAAHPMDHIHEIQNIPLILEHGLNENMYKNVSRTSSLTRKRLFSQSFVFLLPQNPDSRMRLQTFFNTTDPKMGKYRYYSGNIPYSDVSFRQVFYFILNPSGNEKSILNTVDAIMNGNDKIPVEVYVGIVFRPSIIVKLYYLCKYCDFQRYHFHELRDYSPEGLRSKALHVTSDGLSLVWIGVLNDQGFDPAAFPYMDDDISLKWILSKEDIDEDRLLLRLLLSMGNETEYLHVIPDLMKNSNLLKFFKCYPTITTEISVYPEFEMQPIIFDMDSYNFITCHGARIPALRVGAYFDPYDGWVWICIALSVLLTPIFGSVLLRLLHKVDFHTSYLIIMDAIAFALINQYPRGDGKNLRFPPFRFMYRANFGVVILACIILVNVYMSLVITNVTSPMPMLKDYDRVEELDQSLIMVTVYEDTLSKQHVERVIKEQSINE
jgi:hypothetical protein